MAVYRVLERDEGQNTIAYCESVTQPDGRQIARASERGWHCWVECGEFAYDFMAPLFKEVGETQGLVVPRRMFAKPIAAMATSLEYLKRPGDFLLSPDPDMTRERLAKFVESQQNLDLLQVASTWFVPSPKKMHRHIEVMDSKFGKVRWQLTDISVDGIW
jgi:hypothetical protein